MLSIFLHFFFTVFKDIWEGGEKMKMAVDEKRQKERKYQKGIANKEESVYCEFFFFFLVSVCMGWSGTVRQHDINEWKSFAIEEG